MALLLVAQLFYTFMSTVCVMQYLKPSAASIASNVLLVSIIILMVFNCFQNGENLEEKTNISTKSPECLVLITYFYYQKTLIFMHLILCQKTLKIIVMT